VTSVTIGISESQMRVAVAHIVAADPAFDAITASAPLCRIGRDDSPKGDHFADLVYSVVAQQLSTKAADTISGRLNVRVDDELTPARILALDDALLRGAGLSRAKTRTIRGLAQAFADGSLDLEAAIARGDDQYVSAQLQQLWGIGRWTVEMFLIFTLHRLDVWPVGDLAMRRGWQQLHGCGAVAPAELDALGEPLRPYRAVAAWYCWHHVDGDNPSW